MKNEEKKKLFSVSGRPIADNQNVKTAGKRGPMLLEDFWFLEKLAHFDREVIPERRMHAKGSGAFGKFTVTNDITKYNRSLISSQKLGRKHLHLSVSQLWPANVVLLMQNAISVGSL
ncbi:hypothetical protein MASR1M65_15800 [Saprospiraceae bacterium]